MRFVSAPIGGLMNHVRWLALITAHNLDEKWGTWEEFMMDHVYPDHRTCFNWLMFEWNFRDGFARKNFDKQGLIPKDNPEITQLRANLETSIGVTHNIKFEESATKVIILHATPQDCIKHYLKFNPGLFGFSVEKAYEQIQYANAQLAEYAASGVDILRIDATSLYGSELDKRVYDSIVEFFNIPNNYELAAKIHKQWYKLNSRDEQLMKTIPQDFTSYPWTSTVILPPITNQEEYDNALKRIKEVYK